MNTCGREENMSNNKSVWYHQYTPQTCCKIDFAINFKWKNKEKKFVSPSSGERVSGSFGHIKHAHTQ